VVKEASKTGTIVYRIFSNAIPILLDNSFFGRCEKLITIFCKIAS